MISMSWAQNGALEMSHHEPHPQRAVGTSFGEGAGLRSQASLSSLLSSQSQVITIVSPTGC